MTRNQHPSDAIFSTDPENPPDLYEILELSSRDATGAEVRTAYRKGALKCHPDKISSSLSEEEKLEARQKFDQIGFAYKILSDPKLRERYDKTGKTDENSFLDGLDDEASWNAYFKDLWSGEVNAQTIEEFTTKYRGSEEELNDLHEHYLAFDGSLADILSHTMCATDECEPRLIKRIDKSIKDGLLPLKPKWETTKKDIKARAKRRKVAEQESKEAEELAKELGVHDKLYGSQKSKATSSSSKNKKEQAQSSEDALKALIQGNAARKHESLIAKLEAKALSESTNKQSKKSGKNSSKKRKSAADEEDDEEGDQAHSTNGPTEDEFQKIQAELEARKAGKTKGDQKSSQNTRASTKRNKKSKT